MADKLNNQNDSHGVGTLFHDIATPLLIAKMNAELLSSYLPQLLTSLAESPNLQHLLPKDKKVREALISAPDILVLNLGVVQKKINLLSESVMPETNNVGLRLSGADTSGGNPAPSSTASVSPKIVNTPTNVVGKAAVIKTILLVDDEEIHRDIGASLLSPHYAIEFAENGLEAIRKCEQKHYDLILMDLHMPRMNGDQATIALRRRISDQTIIIGLTSLRVDVNQSGLLAAGFTGFLEKPLTLQGLQNVLRTYSNSV